MSISEVLSERGRFVPLSDGHPGVGAVCPGCGEELKAGQRPSLVNPSPPGPEDEGKAAYNAECVMAHESCAYPAAEYELPEAQAEIARHHKTFEEISALVEEGLDPESSALSYWEALKQIRNLVG